MCMPCMDCIIRHTAHGHIVKCIQYQSQQKIDEMQLHCFYCGQSLGHVQHTACTVYTAHAHICICSLILTNQRPTIYARINALRKQCYKTTANCIHKMELFQDTQPVLAYQRKEKQKKSETHRQTHSCVVVGPFFHFIFIAQQKVIFGLKTVNSGMQYAAHIEKTKCINASSNARTNTSATPMHSTAQTHSHAFECKQLAILSINITKRRN